MAKPKETVDPSNIKSLIESGALASLGIERTLDLILYPPVEYTSYQKVETRITEGEDWVNLKIKIITKPSDGKVMNSISFKVVDDFGIQASVMAFGYQFRMLKVGDFAYLRCKVTTFNGVLQLSNAKIIPLSFIGKLIPRYSVKKGIDSDDVYWYIQYAMKSELKKDCDIALMELGLTDIDLKSMLNIEFSLFNIIRSMHNPITIEQGNYCGALLRKIAAIDVVNRAKSSKIIATNNASIIKIDTPSLQKVLNKFPFELTLDQKNAIKDIVDDLAKNQPMCRLLSGDVGHGKSAVIQATSIAVNAIGAKVAILTCNDLLVDQLLKEFNEIDQSLPLLKINGTTKLSEIVGNPIIIGTTAILSRLEKLNWMPNYLIVDEQEKFSRQQREQLRTKSTNILEATATCIPRTGALITHGLMDISLLTQCPVKKKIETFIIKQRQKSIVFDAIKEAVSNKEQVAVIYPIVDKKNEDDNKKSVSDMYAAWERVFPNRVGLLHGKMSTEDKLNTVQRMKDKDFDLLASSSVIERGVTLPSLKTILVVDADRYGLSALHQLRGRLARHGGEGKFYLLVNDDVSHQSLERLNLLVKYTDGFALAEVDMNMRGYGDISENSEAQKGNSESSVFKHYKLTPLDFQNIQLN